MTDDVVSAGSAAVSCERWAVRGAIAALLAGALSAVASALELAQREAAGFTLAGACMLAGVLPQAVVLRAFLCLADATHEGPLFTLRGDRRPNPLRRASICLFGSLWLLIALVVLTQLFPDPARRASVLILLFVGVGLAAFLGYALRVGGLTILLAVYFATKYLGGILLTGERLDTTSALAVTALLLILASVVGYPVWFGIALVRARARLGAEAGLLAGTVFLNVAAFVALVAWSAAALASTPGIGLLDEKALDDLLAPHVSRLTLLGLAGEVLLAVVTTFFFLRVRRRPGLVPPSRPQEKVSLAPGPTE